MWPTQTLSKAPEPNPLRHIWDNSLKQAPARVSALHIVLTVVLI